jgi:aspartate racemase
MNTPVRKKRIGILGGISHESTSKYYESILETYYHRCGDYHYPEIVIFSLDFQRFTDYEDSRDMDGYIQYIMEGIHSLESAGVDFILLAANSPHSVFPKIEEKSSAPLLSIVEVTAEKAASEGRKSLLLLGIAYTMQSSFYQQGCAQRGIEVKTPTEKEQDTINRIIFHELVIGVFSEESKQKLLDIISRYEVDGVILGCTELPLLLTQEDSTKPLYDTLELHAQAALDFALSE